MIDETTPDLTGADTPTPSEVPAAAATPITALAVMPTTALALPPSEAAASGTGQAESPVDSLNARERLKEQRRQVAKMRFIDDTFFSTCLEDNAEAVQEILRIVMHDDSIKINSVVVQKFIGNVDSHSSVLDILATDGSSNKAFALEVQRKSSGAKVERAEAIGSEVINLFYRKGTEFTDLPEIHVVFITEHDVFKKHAASYRKKVSIEALDGDGNPLPNVVLNSTYLIHILFVNGARKANDPIGSLMQDFFCEDPKDIKNKTLKAAAIACKSDERKVIQMCKALEDMWDRGVAEGVVKKGRAVALKMLKDGLPMDTICRYSELSAKEVDALAKENKLSA